MTPDYQTVKKRDDMSYVHSFRHITGIGQTDGRTHEIGKTVSRCACIAVDARAIKIDDIYYAFQRFFPLVAMCAAC